MSDRRAIIIVLFALFVFGMVQAVMHGMNEANKSPVEHDTSVNQFPSTGINDICTAVGTVLNDAESYSVTLNSEVVCKK